MCISGPERTLSKTLPLMKKMREDLNVRPDLQTAMFLAGHGNFSDDLWSDPVWDEKSTVYASQETSAELASPGRRSYSRTLQQCYTLIQAYERRSRIQFSYIIRLRTDGFYNFRWTDTSDWSYTPNLIFTTHCMKSYSEFRNKNYHHCSKTSQCLSDQFAVMSRNVADEYFNGFFATMHNDSHALVLPQECLMAKTLKRVMWKSLCVSKSALMSEPELKLNWGPLRSNAKLPAGTHYMTFPQSC